MGRAAGWVVVLAAAAGCAGGPGSGAEAEGTPPPAKEPQVVRGLERVTAKSGSSSAATREAVAACPAGKKALGGGGRVVGGGREVRLSGMRPDPDGTGYRVRADEDADGYGGSWTVEAYAICALPPAGLEYVTAEGRDDVNAESRYPLGLLVGDRRTGATAVCPEGKQVTGGGAESSDASIRAVVGFTAGEPEPGAPGELTARAIVQGSDAPATAVAHAVCVDPLEGYDRHRDIEIDDGKELRLKTSCGADSQVIGLTGHALQYYAGEFGANVFDGLTLVGAVPNADLTATTLTAARHPDYGDSVGWILSGSSLCAVTAP